MNENDVHIEWNGPMSLEDVEKLTGADDVGIYQIYGPHYAYGAYVLLYIGKTEKSFGARIPAHGWKLNERGSEVRIHVGRIVSPRCNDTDSRSRLLDAIETLLIYAHGPGYNASKITDPNPNNPELFGLRIFNWKNHGVLLPEVSGQRWLSRVPTSKPASAG